jgi:hypothetical protein
MTSTLTLIMSNIQEDLNVESLEEAVRRVGGCCEMVASLLGRESGSRGPSTVRGRCQAAQ